MDNVSTSEASRKTRRARNERAQALQISSISTPPGPAVRPPQDNQVVWRLLAETKPKRKGKEKESSIGYEAKSVVPPGSIEPVAPPGESASALGSHPRRRSVMGPPPVLPIPQKKRKLDHAETVDGFAVTGSSATPTQSRKADEHALATSGNEHAAPTSDRVRTLRASVRSDKSLIEAITSLPPASPSPTIKRIRLIVRKPVPTLSSPLQRLPLPKFGESLTALLSSYSAPEDIDLDEPGLRALRQHDLKVWRTIDALRRQGRMLFRPPDDDMSPREFPEVDTRREPDAWDAVLEAVQKRAEVQLVSGEYVAAQVASRVQAYWDIRAIREDKARAQEEKRLRALAKTTIRMVTAEWKRAVFVSSIPPWML